MSPVSNHRAQPMRSALSQVLAVCALIVLGLPACSPDSGGTNGGTAGETASTKVEAPKSQPAPAEGSDPQAIEVADRVMDALGGRKAWDDTRYVSWNFFGTRRHHWDKWTNDLRVEQDSLTILINIDSKEGRVQKSGVEITDPAELSQYMDMGYAWWVNDTYWMFMPYKLRDPGVTLAYKGEDALEDDTLVDVIELTFGDGIGLTPQNKYDVAVSKETGLVVSWSYYPDKNDEEPRFTMPWADWKKFGKIMIATSHGQGKDWEIAVHHTLPDDVFHSFEPVAS